MSQPLTRTEEIERQAAALREFALALDADDYERIGSAIAATLVTMPGQVRHGEVGAAFASLGRFVRRVRIREAARRAARTA